MIMTMMIVIGVIMMRMVMAMMVVTCMTHIMEENQTDQIHDQSSHRSQHQLIFADIGGLSNSLDCLQRHTTPNKHKENTVNIT